MQTKDTNAKTGRWQFSIARLLIAVTLIAFAFGSLRYWPYFDRLVLGVIVFGCSGAAVGTIWKGCDGAAYGLVIGVFIFSVVYAVFVGFMIMAMRLY
jgi:hypothetical protein